jgi:hypothetical protein
MLIATARWLLSTMAAMMAPCSVKTRGICVAHLDLLMF